MDDEFKKFLFRYIEKQIDYYSEMSHFFLNSIDDDDFYKNGYYLLMGIEKGLNDIKYSVKRMAGMSHEEIQKILTDDTEIK
jgi:hypothetical protein